MFDQILCFLNQIALDVSRQLVLFTIHHFSPLAWVQTFDICFNVYINYFM